MRRVRAAILRRFGGARCAAGEILVVMTGNWMAEVRRKARCGLAVLGLGEGYGPAESLVLSTFGV